MSYFQVTDKCNGCLSCVENCPASALDFRDRNGQRTLRHNMAKCARCGQCWRVCPQNAIEFEHLLVGDWDEVVTLDMVHCRVCGEPLYSTRYEQNLAGKLNLTTEPLCPLHQQRQAASRLPLFALQKTGAKMGDK
jgi:ferredoxin